MMYMITSPGKYNHNRWVSLADQNVPCVFTDTVEEHLQNVGLG